MHERLVSRIQFKYISISIYIKKQLQGTSKEILKSKLILNILNRSFTNCDIHIRNEICKGCYKIKDTKGKII